MNAELFSSFRVPRSSLFCFFMISVFAATAAELAKLKPVRRGLLILGRYVVSTLACTTLKNNIVAWHNFNSRSLNLVLCSLVLLPGLVVDNSTKHQAQSTKLVFYSTISDTVPAPTVRPPSRIAKRNPFSMAMGAINSISIATLSPGITISTPAGKCAIPVTSVVRK